MKKIDEKTYRGIRQRISMGESVTSLAKEFDVSRNSIYVYLRKSNNKTSWEKLKTILYDLFVRRTK